MAVDESDIVAVGGTLDPETLLSAYSRGIFPWPMEGLSFIPWFCPKRRAVVDFDSLHVGRSLARARKNLPFRCTVDTAFRRVIHLCANVPRGDGGTWITDEVIQGYTALHDLGFAHSVETWEGSELVGGVYGVEASGYFSAESMFHLRSYASKIALLHLFEHIRAHGLPWCDIQVMTPHMQAMGAKEIPRREFLRRVEMAAKRGVRLFP